MKGGYKKSPVRNGFTIVEVMIFLAVSGVTFLIAANFINEKQDWVKGRSKCTKCNHELSAIDLIPLLSWLLLGGRCRYCHKKISIQYPIVELLTSIIFLLSYIYWPVPLAGQAVAVYILWLFVVTGLIALSIYDIRWMLLPSRIIYALYPFALFMAVINIFSAANHAGVMIGYVEATIIGGCIFYVLLQVSRGKCIVTSLYSYAIREPTTMI